MSYCSDPPLEEDDIPDGEWLCIECKADPARVCQSDFCHHTIAVYDLLRCMHRSIACVRDG